MHILLEYLEGGGGGGGLKLHYVTGNILLTGTVHAKNCTARVGRIVAIIAILPNVTNVWMGRQHHSQTSQAGNTAIHIRMP